MLEHLNEILDSTQITTSTAAVRLAISFVLGAIIGAERQFRRRDAGMRTFTLIRRHVDIYLDTTNLSEFLEWRSGAYRRPSPYRYWFLGSRSYYSKSWKRAWTHYGGLYLGNGCSRFGRWCRYVLGRFYHYGIYLVRIGFFRKAGATYVFGWC